MSYMSIIEAAESPSLVRRVQAAVAQEAAAADVDIPFLAQWVADRMLRIVGGSGWADKWAYAKDTETVNVNPDTGARTDVISDGDILTAVQPLVLALKPPEEPA